MANLWHFYLDTIDTDAFEQAESGAPIYPKSDWPFLPLVAPWMIAVPALIFLPDQSFAFTAVFCVAVILSIGCYLAVGTWYSSKVQIYREQLGKEE